MTGDVKAVYQDNELSHPAGIIVHKAGLVYVVGTYSHTVHQIETKSGKSKLVLSEKDGLSRPWSIGYCDADDNMYIGMQNNNVLKVYQMK